MNAVKAEATEPALSKHHPLTFVCEPCDIRFSSRDTLDAHRQHYCAQRQTTSKQPAALPFSDVAQSLKRKLGHISESQPTKRLSLLSHDSCRQECHAANESTKPAITHLTHAKLDCQSTPFRYPVQIGPFIYVPIPVRPFASNADPLDLSKPKASLPGDSRSQAPSKPSLDSSPDPLHQCQYCSVHFRSLETLRAHQQDYCGTHRQQKTIENPSRRIHSPATAVRHRPMLFICRLCHYRGHTLRGMRMHFKFHTSNHEPCSDADIIVKPAANVSELPPTAPNPLLKCTICSAMFDEEDALLSHVRYVHTHERFLKCLQCQSRFCSKWNLIRHMKFMHTNVNYDPQPRSDSTFSCPLCQATFRDIELLKLHVIRACPGQSDTDVRPQAANETFCSLCEISFQYKESYDAHRLYYCPRSASSSTQTTTTKKKTRLLA